MRRVFAGFAVVLLLAVVVQFYFAAAGAVDSAPLDESFGLHRVLGPILLVLAVLTTIVAAIARAPGRLIGMSGMIIGGIVLQSVIALVARAFTDSGGASTMASTLVFGLHALNGLAILGLAGRVVAEARRLASSPAVRPAADDEATTSPTTGAQPAS